MPNLDALRRRAFIAAAALTVATSSTLHQDVSANGRREGHWVGSWATAAQGVVGAPVQYRDQTLRLIVRTSVGGNQVRIKLSNELGTQRIVIGAARIALPRSFVASTELELVIPDTDRDKGRVWPWALAALGWERDVWRAACAVEASASAQYRHRVDVLLSIARQWGAP